MPGAFRALRHHNYKLFLTGQMVSFTGNMVQYTAMSWLVYHVLTQNSFDLGVINFAGQIPVLALGLFAGAVIDAVNRHRLLIFTQALFMLQALVLAVLTLTHGADHVPLITFWWALSLSLFSGVLAAFDLPARQAFLLEMVPREDLQNAVALNSLTFNCARILGPALAGGIIAFFSRSFPGRAAIGEGICFLLNTITYSAVLICLLKMKFDAPRVRQHTGAAHRYVADGVAYVAKHPHLLALLVHLGFMALFGISYLMLIPVYAKEVLDGKASVFGQLTAAVGVGAVAGGIIMALRKSVKGLGSHMANCTFGFVAALLAMAWTETYWLAMTLMAAAGFFMVMAMIGSQTLTQTLVPEHMRGRMMSLYTMISVGLMPFGSLISGALAEAWGVRMALIINASVCAAATVYFALRLPRLRESALRTEEYRMAIGAQ